jgi:hypothetical protein
VYIDGVDKQIVGGTTRGTIRTYGGASYPVANKLPDVNYVSIAELADTTGGFIGFLDDYRIYNKVLSASEVLELYNVSPYTSYTINFPEQTLCDILVVGGGGGGGNRIAGGGGAGGIVIVSSVSLLNTYTINVGKGGLAGYSNEDGLSDGKNSEIFSYFYQFPY